LKLGYPTSADDRQKQITEQEKEMAKLEADFKNFVDGLQKQYTEASEKKDKGLEDIKNSGLGLLKSVHAHATKGKSEL
jgi:flagellar motility protein MotE (MotC chaperone)